MAWEEKPGQGALFFTPEDKRKSAASPDYNGYIVLASDYRAGDKLTFGAWGKKTKYGSQMWSLKEDNYAQNKTNGRREYNESKRVKEDRVIDPFGSEDVPF